MRKQAKLPDGLDPNSKFWEGLNVLVTGGAGFIGSHVVENLMPLASSVVIADNLENGSPSNLPMASANFRHLDLNDMKNCLAACDGVDVVLNLAARVAGVGYNAKHPGEMFFTNATINLNMLEAARKRDVERFVVISSACVYERNSPVPTPESHGFVADPEPTNLGYGWAKRMAEVHARVYAEEYGMKISIVRPYNTYGPRDHFDLSRGHVIPSLIRRALSQGEEISVWGDGKQMRSFVYASDLARGLLLAAERYPFPDPINIGSEEEVSIEKLIETILQISGSEARVTFDKTKPSGQPRRRPDLTKAKTLLGYSPRVGLREGLTWTIRWYQSVLKDTTATAALLPTVK